MVTPKKKPKGGKLLAWQKELNAQVSSYRAAVERLVAHFKGWRIFHTDYRRPYRTYHDAFDAARGLFFFAITRVLNNLHSARRPPGGGTADRGRRVCTTTPGARQTAGATDVINSSSSDPRAEVTKLLGADGGPEFVFEAIGLAATIELAYEITARGGTTVVVGQVAENETIQIDPYRLSEDERVLRGSNYGSARISIDFPLMVDLYLSGRLDLDELVTRVRPSKR